MIEQKTYKRAKLTSQKDKIVPVKQEKEYKYKNTEAQELGKAVGPWKDDEHSRFLQGLEVYGMTQLDKMVNLIKTRSKKQV